jgi:hypothetical protein
MMPMRNAKMRCWTEGHPYYCIGCGEAFVGYPAGLKGWRTGEDDDKDGEPCCSACFTRNEGPWGMGRTRKRRIEEDGIFTLNEETIPESGRWGVAPQR